MSAFTAAAPRTFVASYGSDANPCTITSPCRGFAAALAVTSQAGEIIVLDSAGYGPLTINKGVTITAPAGVYAGITAAFGQDAVIVNAPNDYVVLRGLDIRGAGSGVNGINFVAGLGLTVENCAVSYMGYTGIVVSAIDSRVAILGTQLRLNGQYGVAVNVGSTVTIARSAFVQNNAMGINVTNGSGLSPVNLSVVDSVLTSNGSFGVWVDAVLPVSTVAVSITGTTIAGSTMAGVWANSVFGATALVTAGGNSVVQNGHGFWLVGSAKLVLSRNVISNNSGWGVLLQPGAPVFSAGDNLMSDNFSGPASAPLGYIPLQ
ncbi:MAG: right-handed parallel beta-helix repeat-containing protein [Casimicrobiaceae bacterium]